MSGIVAQDGAAGLAAATGSTFAEEPAAVTDDKYAWLGMSTSLVPRRAVV